MTIHKIVAPPTMPAVARILGRYDRPQVESFIEIAVALLDTLDGPADPEEPDFRRRSDGLPGDSADHEPAGDQEPGAYAEWDTLSRQQKRQGTCLVDSTGGEDDELNGGETDGNGAEDEPCAWFAGGNGAPGCSVADPCGDADVDIEPEDPVERKMRHPHRDRTRRDKCTERTYRGQSLGEWRFN